MQKISEVRKRAGVSKRTLQYYDDEGLLTVERTKENHRLYDQEAMEQIWKILMYKEMGFKLKEIKTLLASMEDQQAEYLANRINTIRKQMRQLDEQADFISIIQKSGIPPVPTETGGATYVEYIDEMRKRMRNR